MTVKWNPASIAMAVITLLLGMITSCLDWEYEGVNFVEVSLLSADSISLNQVVLTGDISGLVVSNASDHGFIWSFGATDPTLVNNDGVESLGALTVNNQAPFTTTLDLRPKETYRFRAYASVDGEEYLSDPIIYHTSLGKVKTLSFDYEYNFSIDLEGALEGTELGILAVEHGFCWSTENQQPSLSDEHVNLGNSRTNDPFTYTFEELQNEVTHYFRAYAVVSFDFKFDTIYGETLTFDGDLKFWRQLPDFPGEARSASFCYVINDKAYIGMGDNGEDFSNHVDVWEYDIPNEQWQRKADFPSNGRAGWASFAIDEIIYIGTGLYCDTEFCYLSKDLWAYNTREDTWVLKDALPGGERFQTTAFAINGKGYIGLGWNNNPSNNPPLEDFYEYDPIGNKWRRLADYTGFIADGDEALVFSLGNQIHINASEPFEPFNEPTDLLWTYDPNADVWMESLRFPRRTGLFGASAFEIGGLLYIVTGFIGTPADNPNQPNQFWKFDPALNQWCQLPDFPGSNRQFSFAFSYEGKGYIGTGLSRTEGQRLKDFWVYDP